MNKNYILIDGTKYPVEIVKTNYKTMRVSYQNGVFVIKRNPRLHPDIEPQFLYQENQTTFRRILTYKDNSYKYEPGEIVNIIGKKYLIVASLNTGIYGDCIYVDMYKDPKKEVFKATQKLMLDYFNERTKYFHALYFSDVTFPLVKVKIMKSRYGVYHTKHNYIAYSAYLAHYPLELIDYVIVHELCHTKVKSHQKEFYDLLGSILPNYKILKKKIKEERYISS